MNDREFLIWIHQRLAKVHGENELVDYMHKLRGIIASTPADRLTPNDGRGGNGYDDLMKRLHSEPVPHNAKYICRDEGNAMSTTNQSTAEPLRSEATTVQPSRVEWGQMQSRYWGRTFRGRDKGHQITLRVVDVTFGGDVWIARRGWPDRQVDQQWFLNFVATAKEIG